MLHVSKRGVSALDFSRSPWSTRRITELTSVPRGGIRLPGIEGQEQGKASELVPDIHGYSGLFWHILAFALLGLELERCLVPAWFLNPFASAKRAGGSFGIVRFRS